MRATVLSILFAGTILSASGQACDTVFIGTVDGMSTGANDTPFPTQVNMGSRVQYLFLGSELAATGCSMAMGITGICLQVLDDDPEDVYMDVQVKLKNTVTPGFNTFELPGLNLNASVFNLHVEQGLLCIPFDSPFQWNGAMNVVVEIAYSRNALPGSDLRVLLDLGLSFNATRWAHDATFTPGWWIDEAVPVSALRGTETSRPVLGLVLAVGTTVSTQIADGDPVLYPNPASGDFVLTCVDVFNTDDAIEIVDVNGRVLRTMHGGGSRKVLIERGGLSPGMYVVRLTRDHSQLGAVRVVVE